jgi:polysaccharide export outer membrane protein
MKALDRKYAPRLALVALCLTVSCGAPGSYIWFDQVPPQTVVGAPYVIKRGDLLDVRVYNEDRVSTKTRVRLDGKITLPLLGDIEAAETTPHQLAQRLTERLQRYIKAPGVSVSIDEIRPMQVTVLGEVTTPGNYALRPGDGLLQALGAAGGLTEFADEDQIFLLRQQPHKLRVRFRYDALAGNEPRAVAFALQDGDVIAVE